MILENGIKVYDRLLKKVEEPKNYPCIAVGEIQYDGFGPDMLEYELVYPEDFEAK